MDAVKSNEQCPPNGRDQLESEMQENPSWQAHFNKEMQFGVTALEANAIIKQVEKLDKEGNILNLLTRVEQQNRHLTIYGSVILTLVFVFMLFSTYLLKETHALLGKSPIKVASGISVPQPPENGAHPLKADNQPQSAAPAKAPNNAAAPPLAPKEPAQAGAGENVTLTSESHTPALQQQILKMPAGQAPSPVINTPRESAVPMVDYIGSITSNKYHYRDCKWAKTIIPRKVRVFHSVAEAHKAGYISCPTCKPPLTDDPDTSAQIK